MTLAVQQKSRVRWDLERSRWIGADRPWGFLRNCADCRSLFIGAGRAVLCLPCHIQKFYPAPRSRQQVYQIVQMAIGRGLLERLPDGITRCTDCDFFAQAYDHRDYEKPLEVVPVCGGCNARRGRAKNWMRA